MAFEDAIDRLNVAVTTRLSDVTAKVDGQSVRGLFDREYFDVNGIGASSPMLDIDAADMPFDVEQGSSVQIGVETFEVAEVQPDGGRLKLKLKAED